jgi:hypothetical protein
VFFERWMSRLPVPLTDADRAAGYWWESSMRQIEVSRTIVFIQPRHARGFFEALVADKPRPRPPGTGRTDLRWPTGRTSDQGSLGNPSERTSL